MPRAQDWLGAIRRIFGKSSCKTTDVLNHTNFIRDAATEDVVTCAPAEVIDWSKDDNNWRQTKELTLEDLAAIKIQASFRGHLARVAFRALRSLVKLQALVRGVNVRRQMRIAIRCMERMVRLQVKLRARQLLSRSVVGNTL